VRFSRRALVCLLSSLLSSPIGLGPISSGAIVAVCALPAAAQTPLQKALMAEEAPPAPAEGQPAAPAAKAPDPAAIEARRNEVAAERAALQARITAAGGEADAEPGLAERVIRLERLERTYGRQLDALRRLAGQSEFLATLDRQLAEGPQSAIGSEPPFPLEVLDRLLDTDAQQRERKPSLEAAVAAAEKSVGEAKRALEEREAARRIAKESVGAAADDAARAEAERALRQAELASETARERVLAEELALQNARQDLEIQRKNELALAAQIAFVQERLALREDELAKQLAAIEQAEFALREGQPAAAQAVQSAERRLNAVQKRADAEAEPGPALRAELDARRIGLLLAQRHAGQIEDELERVAELRRLWQGRWRVLSGEASRDEVRAWSRELTNIDADRDRDRRLVESRIADIERERAALAARAPAPAEGATSTEEQRWLAEQAREMDEALAEARQQLAGLAENQRVSERLGRALGVREERATLADRAADAYDAVGTVWSKELIAVEDNPITVGKVTTAILLFGLGILISRVIAGGFSALVRRRSSLDEGAVAAIQSLAFYALVALFFLVALNSVNIPLTAFTVAGGAIAIGIGFGSQAVVNNFVSGLILMIERPIKVGDMVVYADASGRVERIGPRSTRIRTADNVHLIVPNSKLLDNNVVNWTLSDDVVRTRVVIGVTYGTPTRDVEKLLLEVMAAQPEILKHPRPTVLFEDFAADSLRFQADFFVKLSPLLDDRVVRSNLRHAIDETFRQRGIVIAYPTRDLAAHVPAHERPPGRA
jgi:small-conductance mechanosensitive channel